MFRRLILLVTQCLSSTESGKSDEFFVWLVAVQQSAVQEGSVAGVGRWVGYMCNCQRRATQTACPSPGEDTVLFIRRQIVPYNLLYTWQRDKLQWDKSSHEPYIEVVLPIIRDKYHRAKQLMQLHVDKGLQENKSEALRATAGNSDLWRELSIFL